MKYNIGTDAIARQSPHSELDYVENVSIAARPLPDFRRANFGPKPLPPRHSQARRAARSSLIFQCRREVQVDFGSFAKKECLQLEKLLNFESIIIHCI